MLPLAPCALKLTPILGIALALGACPAERAMQVPPGPPQVLSQKPAGTYYQPSEGSKKHLFSKVGAVGASCLIGSECASAICEGASCDGRRPGSCVAEDRVCTADVVEYCGCDGKTFMSPSGCPGEALAKLGPCNPGIDH